METRLDISNILSVNNTWTYSSLNNKIPLWLIWESKWTGYQSQENTQSITSVAFQKAVPWFHLRGSTLQLLKIKYNINN